MKTTLNSARFFRDPQQAKISGVCAGIAKHLDINPWIVRALVALVFLKLPLAVALAYVLTVLLVRYK